MPAQKKWSKILALSLLIGGVLCLHYFTSHDMKFHHAVYRALFYLPLVLGSFWFGIRGTLYVSLTICFLFFPYVITRWQGLSFDDFSRLLEGTLFIAIAFLLGFLIEKERRKHKALVRSESLAAVGRAVSEIAHDMKAPLMAISGFTQIALRKLKISDPNYNKLEIVIQETTRLDSMVKEMLDFGKPVELNLTTTNANELVQESLKLAQPIASEAGIKLESETEPPIVFISVDIPKVKQVLLNLFTNAIQASAEGERVFVKTHLSKSGVAIDVIDCGCGIKKENHKRVFEPFFSTKCEGTGLGLGNVKKITQAHGGEVTFRANTDKGVTFTVRFPRHGILKKTSPMLISANITEKPARTK